MSRRTDVPAHFWERFVEEWKSGVLRFRHPFGGEREVRVEVVRAVVFWSKYPEPQLRGDFLDRFSLPFYMNFTLNDYEREGLEPNLPPLSERLRVLKEWSARFGRERLVWRFDPIVLGGPLSVDEILSRFSRLAEEVFPFVRRLVFSFVDLYPKVRRNLPPWVREPTEEERRELGSRLAEECAAAGVEISACCEDVEGVPNLGCVDPLILAEGVTDPLLLSYFGFEGGRTPSPRSRLKDRGQRRECVCFPSVDVGTYSTCPFRCLYCYAI